MTSPIYLDDIRTMAQTIWGEARGGDGDRVTGEPEDFAAMCAVGRVILNRWRSGKWFAGISIAATCLKRKQFSCWNPGDPNFKYLAKLTVSEKVFAECVRAAYAVLTDQDGGDRTNGACHYYAKSIPAPNWAVGRKPDAEIGGHLFFSGIT